MGVRLPVGLLAVVAACGAKDQRSGEGRRDGGDAAIGVAPGGDAGEPAAPVTPPGTLAPYLLAPTDDAGAVVVKVVWKDAPVEVRASPGRDRCKAPRDPYAAVHTLHGVGDVVVWLDGITSGKAPPAQVPVTIARRGCRLDPVVQIAPRVDADLQVGNFDETAAEVTVTWADALEVATPAVTVARFNLPVVGHSVAMPLGRPWLIAVTSDAGTDPAYLVVPPHPYVALTDDTGAARLSEVPPGTYPVRAWLRGLAGQPARLAEGTVTVEATVEAEVTLSLTEEP